MILPHQPQFFCWGITGFQSQVRAQPRVLRATVNVALISSGTVGREFFFLVIRLAAMKCVLGLSRRVSGVHLENLCYCSVTGGGNVPQVELCPGYRAVLLLEW